MRGDRSKLVAVFGAVEGALESNSSQLMSRDSSIQTPRPDEKEPLSCPQQLQHGSRIYVSDDLITHASSRGVETRRTSDLEVAVDFRA